MNNEQKPTPGRKKIPPKDLIIIALGVFIVFRIPWNNMNSFHYLLLFLFILCMMLRWSNMRKEAERKRILAEQAAAKAASQSSVGETPAEADTPVEEIPSDAVEVLTENTPAPTEEKPE